MQSRRTCLAILIAACTMEIGRAAAQTLPPVVVLPTKQAWRAEPLSLFIVIEGDHCHVSLLDGDHFELIHRFALRAALQGEPRITPNGRFAYFGTCDGWITKYDLWNLTMVAEVHVGPDTQNLALSGDGLWLMAASAMSNTLVLFDADLNLVRSYPVTTLDRKTSSRVSVVRDAPLRSSFVVAFTDLHDLWEISYNPKAEPIYDGLVHDYKMGEAIATPGYLGVRRTPLDEPLNDFFFDPSFRHVVGSTLPKGNVFPQAQVINLDIRRRVASFALSDVPHLGEGITFAWNGTLVRAFRNLNSAAITVLDMKTWRVVKIINAPGPGYFMSSHENSPYIWVDAMMSPKNKDTLMLIDKNTLEFTVELNPVPGKSLAHVEFSRDGRYALAILMGNDGAIIAYDATTLQEVKRLPMKNPLAVFTATRSVPGAARQ